MKIFGFQLFGEKLPGTIGEIDEELQFVNHVLKEGLPSQSRRKELEQKKAALQEKRDKIMKVEDKARALRDKQAIDAATSAK